MKSIYLTDYYNSGQKTEEEYNRIADMMSYSRKQQGQYRKIIKDDNPDSSVSSIFSVLSSSTVPSITSSSSVPSSVPSIIPSSNISSTVSSTSASSTSSTPVIPMTDGQFKEYISKVCGDMYINMYKHIYNQLYNDIKSEVSASLPKKESTNKLKTKNIKNTKGIQLNSQIEDPTDNESDDE